MNLMNCKSPDIAYIVSKLSKYTCSSEQENWNALSRVLRYLKYSITFYLIYQRYLVVLEGLCDANWIVDSEESKSTSGYVFTLARGFVSGSFSDKHILLNSLWNLRVLR